MATPSTDPAGTTTTTTSTTTPASADTAAHSAVSMASGGTGGGTGGGAGASADQQAFTRTPNWRTPRMRVARQVAYTIVYELKFFMVCCCVYAWTTAVRV